MALLTNTRKAVLVGESAAWGEGMVRHGVVVDGMAGAGTGKWQQVAAGWQQGGHHRVAAGSGR